MNIAIVRLYAATTHWMPDSPAPRSCWMSGIAAFTIIASRKIMNSPSPVATSVHVERFVVAPPAIGGGYATSVGEEPERGLHVGRCDAFRELVQVRADLLVG